jgi:pimeloyl-ACP methyl ester carboxylesterase
MMALHGLASSGHWYDLVAPLLRDQYRVIAPDQRGHGKTTQTKSGYDWQTLASDVVGLMDWLGVEQTAVLGHSWGGNVATNVAGRFPNRVRCLVMIDGGFFSRRSRLETTWESFKARAVPRDVSGTRQQFLDRLRTQLADCWSPEVERIVQTMVYEDPEGQIHDILHPDNHAQVLRTMWDEPPSAILPRIRCRTLIVPAGPKPDRAGSDFARRREKMVAAAARLLQNGRVHWIPETIHDIGYHKPQELARVIGEFLGEGG